MSDLVIRVNDQDVQRFAHTGDVSDEHVRQELAKVNSIRDIFATMKIIYHRPDHPVFLQEYVWQDFDKFPYFPEARKFLRFWKENIEGPIKEAWLGSRSTDDESDINMTNNYLTLH